jgi:hypothetical protein
VNRLYLENNSVTSLSSLLDSLFSGFDDCTLNVVSYILLCCNNAVEGLYKLCV